MEILQCREEKGAKLGSPMCKYTLTFHFAEVMISDYTHIVLTPLQSSSPHVTTVAFKFKLFKSNKIKSLFLLSNQTQFHYNSTTNTPIFWEKT